MQPVLQEGQRRREAAELLQHLAWPRRLVRRRALLRLAGVAVDGARASLAVRRQHVLAAVGAEEVDRVQLVRQPRRVGGLAVRGGEGAADARNRPDVVGTRLAVALLPAELVV